MGVGSSTSFSSLPTNELLLKFVGQDVITYNDPYWNALLSFASKVPRNSADSRLLDESALSLFRQLVRHTTTTSNLATLVAVFLARAVELDESASSVFVWQAHNALFIVRVVLKLLLEHYTEQQAVDLLQANSTGDAVPVTLPTTPLCTALLGHVATVLSTLPVTSTTYALHLESCTLLTAALSGRVCQRAAPEAQTMFSLLEAGCGSAKCRALVLALLFNTVQRPPPPPDEDASASFVAGLAAGLWSVLTLGLSSNDSSSSTGEGSTGGHAAPPLRSVSLSPLAEQSTLLLLVLSTHSADGGSNAFRDALYSIANRPGESSSGRTHSTSEGITSVPYPALYSALTATLHTEHTTLLLYLLLHNNTAFRTYLLSVSELEAVVLPLLYTLHSAPTLSSHHVYMALIVLLILSEDAAFNVSLHDIAVPSVSWYCERPLHNISLGDLLILVLIRTITFNMTKTRDRYLHSNCLAALANMSSQFRGLHSITCQRLLGLLETLSRRRASVTAAIRERGSEGQDDELLSDLGVVEEVLRMVLEILNSTLTHQLGHNSQLLYTLLYKRHVFLPFSTQPNFSDVCMNIDVVLSFLMNRLEKTTSDPSVADVQQVIEQGVLQLPKDRLRKFPELKFKYVEESSPEEFFIPYVWTLVYQSSGLYWPPDSVALFDPSGQDT